MKILLVGNGINLSLASNPEKYNILISKVDNFLEVIGYKKNDDLFDIQKFVKWLGGPGRSKESKDIYDVYGKIDNSLAFDLELLTQLYFSSLKFQNYSRKKRNEILEWINKLKKYVQEILNQIKDIFPLDISEKINKKYDHIITTNYDLNLERSYIKNVYHAHGNIDDVNSIELVTFKKYRSLLSEFKKWISKDDNEKIYIDIFGISLFNEIHILNVLFNLRMEFKDKLQINHYIYAETDADFNFHDISNLYLNYFYGISWGSKPIPFREGVPNKNNSWSLDKIDQFDNSSQKNTFLNNTIIKQYMYKKNPNSNEDDIRAFKFIFNFCKSINIFSHSEHFLNELDSSFKPSTIEIDLKKIDES